MKRAKEVLPFIKQYTPAKSSETGRLFKSVKDGKIALALMTKCERGLSDAAFTKFMESATFKRGIKVIMSTCPARSKEATVQIFRNIATTFHRLKSLDGKIPWELYMKAYPCLAHADMEPSECRGKIGCEEVLTRNLNSTFSAILLRHDILAQEGGFFADRLITAIEMGVPFERIKNSRRINLAVGIEILKNFFPECDEKWVEGLTKDFAAIYESHRKP